MPNDKVLRLTKELNLPTEQEQKFLLALIGADPPNNGPRTVIEAYQCLRPNVSKQGAHFCGWALLDRIKAKGGFGMALDLYGLGIGRVLELLDECSRAEIVTRVNLGRGVWDYEVKPDFRVKHRVAQTLAILHGVLTPGAGSGPVPGSPNTRESFGEAVLRQREEQERQKLKNERPQDADYEEVKE